MSLDIILIRFRFTSMDRGPIFDQVAKNLVSQRTSVQKNSRFLQFEAEPEPESEPKVWCNDDMFSLYAFFFRIKCNFFDNDDSKGQFHCDKCNICRIAGQENFYHCDGCDCCIHISLKDKHNCIKNTDCPYLF